MQAIPLLNRIRCNRARLNLALAALTVLLASCSGNGALRHNAPRVTGPAGTPRMQAIGQKELALARQQLDGLKAPVGMDSATFAQLKAELGRLIEARASGKGVSVLPNSTRNFPPDLAVADDGAGGFTMTWSYTNAGDYDLNGEVNVADLTPIGANFHATTSSPNWTSAQAADGDANGEVNIADVTPIGANFFSQALGYNIYGAADQAGPWTFVTGIPLSSAASGFPRKFSYPLPSSGAYAWYTVSPYDSTGADWLNGGGGGGGTGATVSVGNETVDTSSPVSESGGTVQGPVGTPVEGVTVELPPGAVDTNTNISIGHTDGSIVPVLGTFGGTIMTLHTDGIDQFYEPVKITVPMPGDYLPVPYYINDQQQLQVMDLANIDTAGGKFSFYTWHASAFTWLWENPPGTAGWRDGIYSTDFTPQSDGFQIVNLGSQYNAKGECAGMTAFAQWYFRNYSQGDGDFWPRFMDFVGTSPRLGQMLIATRAHTSTNLYFYSYWPSIRSQLLLSDVGEYSVLRNAIANTHQPVDMYITGTELAWNVDAHAIMAIGVDNGTVHLYDPNHPYQAANPSDSNRSLFIPDSLLADFQAYGSFVNFYYVGDGTMYINEPYNHIYQDARANFNSSEKARVVITSHVSGDTVTDRNPTISGQVQSGSVLIDKLEILADGVTVNAPLDANGFFNVVVPLKSGDNYLTFNTKGTLIDKGRICIPNDQVDRFKLICNTEITTVLVTLTWDQAEDLDLYVIDPSSNTAWYQNQTTADGGELDVDNTGGYGPEHFTLTSTDTTRFNQPYMLKVHKYASGEKFTKWTMTVQLNEGEPVTYTGTLTTGDPSNNDPFGTGSDWGGFIEISPIDPAT